MNRRDFVKILPATTLLPSVVKGYTLKALGLNPMMEEALTQNAENNDHVLVIVQLNGGNDGLNTIIPLSNYSDYFSARQNIAIPQNQVLGLNGYTQAGLHPALAKFQEMYSEGKLEIIQAVGYPEPNFSHFRATDIWQSASNSQQVLNTGWQGRFLNYLYPNFPTGYPNTTMPDPLAIQIGAATNLISQGPVQNMAMSIVDPTNFYNLLSGNTGTAPNTNAGYELTYVRTLAQQTNTYGTQVTTAANNVPSQFSGYPSNNTLADQLKIVARLIKGGLKTKVYMVSFGGFDTHASQADGTSPTLGTHAQLLQKVSEAIWAFQKDTEFLGIQNKVLGMTYSEFGRRIMSNASLGTDHGAAAPMFLFGTNVLNQVVGNNPDLSLATSTSNIPFQYDFRSVYASILEKWFCLDFTTVQSLYVPTVNTTLQSLPIVNNAACSTMGVQDYVAKTNKLRLAPNPFTDFVQLEFTSDGGYIMIQLLDGGGTLIDAIISKEYSSGKYSFKYNTEYLPIGLYYFRFQNGLSVESVSALKKR